ncbi:DUF998 domain-containing protein [Streptomyces flavofungini]|uniref:DUF998 domain-containing protein n=1 Tax=Streptomyces flavofungini TaxID=68200 RepID=A0ABS0XC05_9ACTN|nr:DUF998 domain-containing protein [Streptomyces flavofungini]MBJ3810740.1 DUF998 domain-containing protein [Streptomyces flavofungini]GHC51659.1 hypothetical protein GCM10010349_16900 [Streptomyces flavofungini]
MTTTPVTARDAATSISTTAVRPARALLTAGVAATPLWTVAAVTQALTRDSFDLTRHPFSMLANGSLGWIQITNFLLVGTLFIAAATGLRRVLRGSTGGTWVPRLVRVVGVGMIAAGVFVLDPGDGFPAGTPTGRPESMSWHGGLHLVAGSVTFFALIAACLILGRHFSRVADRRSAIACRAAAVAVGLGNGWAMSGGPAGSLTLAIGVIAGMTCVSSVAARYRRGL